MAKRVESLVATASYLVVPSLAFSGFVAIQMKAGAIGTELTTYTGVKYLPYLGLDSFAQKALLATRRA